MEIGRPVHRRCLIFLFILFERKINMTRTDLFSSYPTTTPLHWRSINPPWLLFFITRPTDFEEKIEGLGTGYRLADDQSIVGRTSFRIIKLFRTDSFTHYY